MADLFADPTAFIAKAGWAEAERRPLAGDASSRRYERLWLPDRTAVLMIDPCGGGATRRFARIAQWLLQHGYSAPALLADDHEAGFLLLEDLGDAVAARVIHSDPSMQMPIYQIATDLLSDLRRHRPPAFVHPLDGPALGALLDVVPEWYLAGADWPRNPAADDISDLVAAIHDRFSDGPPVMSLRDFHAENILWLAGRDGTARLGLLDFQDAVAAHPAYDLVSLLQDARRDVPDAIEAAMLYRSIRSNGDDPTRFRAIYALLGAQRALRIIGVFARLAMRDGKPHYLAYMPRVWRALGRNLEHPDLAPLLQTIRSALPEPTPDILERIKAKCGRFPMA